MFFIKCNHISILMRLIYVALAICHIAYRLNFSNLIYAMLAIASHTPMWRPTRRHGPTENPIFSWTIVNRTFWPNIKEWRVCGIQSKPWNMNKLDDYVSNKLYFVMLKRWIGDQSQRAMVNLSMNGKFASKWNSVLMVYFIFNWANLCLCANFHVERRKTRNKQCAPADTENEWECKKLALCKFAKCLDCARCI